MGLLSHAALLAVLLPVGWGISEHLGILVWPLLDSRWVCAERALQHSLDVDYEQETAADALSATGGDDDDSDAEPLQHDTYAFHALPRGALHQKGACMVPSTGNLLETASAALPISVLAFFVARLLMYGFSEDIKHYFSTDLVDDAATFAACCIGALACYRPSASDSNDIKLRLPYLAL
ncbi:unnamed protein product [Symbiodinium natans]|uniref:Uncharacterized protein n=1 Tax=Symbiodinium natans TaxID=878477 RepID=A0A812MTD4_9DINO|nr:unnamed protein product [Symbiodinium natans]